ncbi:hillarin [Biomphalaria pfeifferi]|uniref:Hillarin n=1 Tax=Biomphalaria pfeifferi TaxID=112525 RepID=A0AAD8C290_BIOPF|nr:hillarin [Biomphalaria pfeifferi]
MAELEDSDSIERGYRRLSTLFMPPNLNLQKCQRCNQTVYQQERVGPVNDVIFHKQCFNCCVCKGYLNLKNYWTNQGNNDDKEVYCQGHAPRIGGSRVDSRAVGIQGAIAAQDNFRKASSKMTELRFQGEQPGYALDHEALGIKAGLAKGRQQSLGPISEQFSGNKYTIDENAVHIRGAINAQLLQKKYQRKLDKHHFPPHIAKKREQLFDAQKRLEEQLRKEEDELLRGFQEERVKEGQAINKEIDTEWESKLQELTDRYEKDLNKKKKKLKDADTKMITIQFENEKKSLAETLKMKKENKRNTMTLRLRQKEQQQTAELVKKQSQIMLEMLAKEQRELKAELAKESLKAKHNGRSEENGTILEEVIDILPITSVTAPPSPEVPSCRKEDIFSDVSVFQSIDEQVLKVAESEQLTYTDLVRQLTEDLMSDLEKARAIYRWICVKDLNVMEFDDGLNVDTPMGLLRGIKLGTETYHVLFMRLCSYAGLHCVEIKGHSKSVGYEPGMKISPTTFQNTWNAVLIDREWRLIQCNWGARHLVLSKDKEDKKKGNDHIRYQYDEHYFMTNPDEFIQEFWPQDPKWQLLESPITLEEFEALPFVRSIFFQYKMRFEGHKLAVIHTDDKGGAKIIIRVPEEHENDLVFFYQLRFAEKEKAKETMYQGSPLERFVFQTMVDNTVTFSVHVPCPGQFFIEIFANKIDDSGRVEENNASVAPFKLKCACKFKIVCETLSGKMHPLPNCAAGEWGPKKAQRHFGIIPLKTPKSEFEMEKVGILTVEDNFELKFQIPHPYQFVAKLRMNHVESKVLDPFVNLTTEGTILSVYVSLPQPGQYGLDLFARPKGAVDTHSLSHACKYLINCTRVASVVQIPKTVPAAESKRSKFGPTAAFEEMGLKLVAPKEAKIQVTKTNGLSLEIKVPPKIVLSYQFLREPDEDNRDYVTQTQESNGVVKFAITLPKKGNYMLSVYARKEDGEKKSAPNVFNFIVQFSPEAEITTNLDKNSDKKSFFKKSLFKKQNSKEKFSDKISDKSSDKST